MAHPEGPRPQHRDPSSGSGPGETASLRCKERPVISKRDLPFRLVRQHFLRLLHKTEPQIQTGRGASRPRVAAAGQAGGQCRAGAGGLSFSLRLVPVSHSPPLGSLVNAGLCRFPPAVWMDGEGGPGPTEGLGWEVCTPSGLGTGGSSFMLVALFARLFLRQRQPSARVVVANTFSPNVSQSLQTAS